MNLPEKCRENTYIQYGQDGKPEYVVVCKTGGGKVYIEKVIPLRDKVNEVVLPRVVGDTHFFMPTDLGKQCEAIEYYKSDRATNYAKGVVRIKNLCFEGMGDIKVVVPFRNSIMLENKAFDSNTNIEFVLPSGMTFRNVSREYGTRYKGYEDWVVITDEQLYGKIDWKSPYLPEVYRAKEFDPESIRSVRYSISKESAEERLYGKKSDTKELVYKTMSMKEFGEYYAHEHDNQM